MIHHSVLFVIPNISFVDFVLYDTAPVSHDILMLISKKTSIAVVQHHVYNQALWCHGIVWSVLKTNIKISQKLGTLLLT